MIERRVRGIRVRRGSQSGGAPPTPESAIKRAIEEFDIHEPDRPRLIAQSVE